MKLTPAECANCLLCSGCTQLLSATSLQSTLQSQICMQQNKMALQRQFASNTRPTMHAETCFSTTMYNVSQGSYADNAKALCLDRESLLYNCTGCSASLESKQTVSIVAGKRARQNNAAAPMGAAASATQKHSSTCNRCCSTKQLLFASTAPQLQHHTCVWRLSIDTTLQHDQPALTPRGLLTHTSSSRMQPPRNTNRKRDANTCSPAAPVHHADASSVIYANPIKHCPRRGVTCCSRLCTRITGVLKQCAEVRESSA
jgi:hypothetical protein